MLNVSYYLECIFLVNLGKDGMPHYVTVVVPHQFLSEYR